MIALVASGLTALFLLGACDMELASELKGSGAKKTERRNTGAFTRVDLEGAAEVAIVVGKARSVKVSGDDNLLSNLRTEVEGDTLVISTRHSYRSRIGMLVEIGVPALNGVDLTGSGKIRIRELEGDFFTATLSGSGYLDLAGVTGEIDLELQGSGRARLDRFRATQTRLSISGSGEITASGQTDSLEVEIPGSGNASLDELSASNVTAAIDGSGAVSLVATGTLDASISGSGSITYAGNPRDVSKNVSGSGAIIAL